MFNKMLGFTNDKDEREQYIINKQMTAVLLMSFCLLLALSIVSLTFDANNNTLSIGSISLIVLILFISVSVLLNLKKYTVNKELVTSETEYKNAVKKEGFKSILASVFFIAMSTLLNIVFQSIISRQLSFSFSNILGWLIAGIIFGMVSYIFGKKKINLEK